VHGVGGFLGIVLLGILGSTAWNPAGADGLLLGGTAFFLKQCVAAVLCAVWAFIFTYGMLWLIDQITATRTDHTGKRQASTRNFTGRRPTPKGCDGMGAFR